MRDGRPPGDRSPGRLRLRQARARGLRQLRSGSLVAEAVALPMLIGLAVAVGLLATVASEWSPPSLLVLPVLVGGLLLRTRQLYSLVFVVGCVLALDVWALGWSQTRPGGVVAIGLVALFARELARSRELLGVQGLRGESMLVELRDRLQLQGEMPSLPAGWASEVVTRTAGGSSFGGDFLVASRTSDGKLLEMVLVDVSGKGVDAGTRALLLSGAFGSLLGAVEPERFLPAANAYLLRQEWGEGFATAVHLVVDLVAGDYLVESAGHPPAAHFDAGSGRWRLTGAEGPLLGVLPEVEFRGERGVLRHGDALLLFTDGLIELPGRDLATGIDKLLGEAERLIPVGFEQGAQRLIHAVARAANDDRALVMLWRT